MGRLTRRLPVFMVLLAALLVADALFQEHGSNVLAAYRADRVTEELRREWSRPLDRAGSPALPADVTAGRVRLTEGFALLYVPRLRSTAWEVPVLHGASSRELNRGVGHHEDSALPWQDGNVVISGHRTSYGRPFAEIEDLQVGDEVYLETRDAWFVYTLVDDAVVKPDALWVKRAQPTAAVAGAERIITLVTCTPKGSVSKRWVWWGTLTEVREKSDPPAGFVAAAKRG